MSQLLKIILGAFLPLLHSMQYRADRKRGEEGGRPTTKIPVQTGQCLKPQ